MPFFWTLWLPSVSCASAVVEFCCVCSLPQAVGHICKVGVQLGVGCFLLSSVSACAPNLLHGNRYRQVTTRSVNRWQLASCAVRWCVFVELSRPVVCCLSVRQLSPTAARFPLAHGVVGRCTASLQTLPLFEPLLKDSTQHV
jgi:hypothetical protein